jgi:hypothetical protein
MLQWAATILWLGGGAYGMVAGLRNLRYVLSLPTSPGNEKVKRTHYMMLGLSLSIVIGAMWLRRALGL